MARDDADEVGAGENVVEPVEDRLRGAVEKEFLEDRRHEEFDLEDAVLGPRISLLYRCARPP